MLIFICDLKFHFKTNLIHKAKTSGQGSLWWSMWLLFLISLTQPKITTTLKKDCYPAVLGLWIEHFVTNHAPLNYNKFSNGIPSKKCLANIDRWCRSIRSYSINTIELYCWHTAGVIFENPIRTVRYSTAPVKILETSCSPS